jgi:hypothetical protein
MGSGRLVAHRRIDQEQMAAGGQASQEIRPSGRKILHRSDTAPGWIHPDLLGSLRRKGPQDTLVRLGRFAFVSGVIDTFPRQIRLRDAGPVTTDWNETAHPAFPPAAGSAPFSS